MYLDTLLSCLMLESSPLCLLESSVYSLNASDCVAFIQGRHLFVEVYMYGNHFYWIASLYAELIYVAVGIQCHFSICALHLRRLVS